MLRILDKNKQPICGLDRYRQLRITKRLQFDDKTLEFNALIGDIADLENEGYIETETDRFVVKEIRPSSDGTADVLAQLDLETLEGNTFLRFETVEKTLSEAMAVAFAGTGWTVGECEITKRRTLRKENCTSLDMLKQALSVYRCECKINSKQMTVSFYEEIGEDRGVYFMSDLNLRSLTVTKSSYDFYTEIEPYGANGMTIEDVNNGSKILTNYTYSNKQKRIIWKDERYSVPESLKEDAQAKLNDYSKPYVSYMADVVDLASMSDDYSILEYDIGDTITLADNATGTREKQRIVEMVVYPEEPELNSCVFANTTLTFEELAAKFNETADTVDNITIDNGTIDGNKINGVDASKIANFDTVLAASAVFGDLVANHAAFEEATVSRFTADEASITELRTNYADVAIAKINVLETDYGAIRDLLAGNAAATQAQMIHLNAQNALIDEAFLKSLMAQYITVNDLLAGTIYTNKHTVMSEDGAMVMDGSVLTFKDANGTVRIQIGKDGQGNYNYYLVNADGDIIWDATGITKDGIPDGLIVDDMVADSTDTYHGISASKLNIHSMIGAINEEGGLKSSSIVMDEDGQSLTVAFTNMREGIDSLAKGGNNLIVGTLNPDVSEITKYPKIIGQTVPTVINGTAAVAEHGIKSIGSAGTAPGFEFGSDSTASASMNGLKAGETYTLSFDAAWKLFSEYTGTDKQELNMVFGYMPTQSSSFIYKTIPISEVTSGTDESCSFNGTFTVPDGCVAVYIGIAGDNDYMQINDDTLLYLPYSPGDTIEINGTQIQVDSFADTDYIEINGNPIPKQGGLCADGDYIELKNLKLERGSIATAWSPAPEDYQAEITNRYSELTVTIDGITGRVGTLETTTTEHGQTLASHTTTITQTANKINRIITDSQISELDTGTSMYDKLLSVEETADGVKTDVTSLKTWKDTATGQITAMDSRQNTFEQNLSGTTSRVSSLETNLSDNYSTTSDVQSLINQKAGEITLSVSNTYATKTDAVSAVSIEYAKGTSATTAPESGWSTSSPTWEQDKYIWQRTAITKNGQTTYSNVSCIQGAKGQDGDGVGIRSIVPRYCLWTSNSPDNPPANNYSGWSENSKPDWEANKYLWTQTKIIYDDDTTANPHVEYTTAICDTTLNSLETRMTRAEQKITDDAIISTVWKTYGIGDANLIYNSTGFGGAINGWQLSSTSSCSIIADYSATRPGKTDFALGIENKSSYTRYMYNTSEHYMSTVSGKKYTLSGYYYRGSSVNSASISLESASSKSGSWSTVSGSSVTFSSTGSWQFFSVTVTAPSNYMRVCVTHGGSSSSSTPNCVLYVEDLVLVQGDEAMPWAEMPVSQIEQTPDAIRLRAEKLVWVADNSSLDENGELTVTSGEIGGFVIDDTCIRNLSASSTSTGAVLISSANITRTIAGVSKSNVRFAIGANMGVLADGTLYAKDGVFSGEIVATSGTLGGIGIGERGILSRKAGSPSKVLYISDDGIFHVFSINDYDSWGVDDYRDALFNESSRYVQGFFYVDDDGKVKGNEFSNGYWRTDGRALRGYFDYDYPDNPYAEDRYGLSAPKYKVSLYAGEENSGDAGFAIDVSDVTGSSPVRNFLVRYSGSTQCTSLTISSLSSGTGSTVVANSSGRLYYTSSSKRYKDYIADMTESEAEKLYDLPVVQFKYKEGYLDREDEAYDKPLHGFFAEDVADIFDDGGIHNAAGDVENYSERAIIARLVKLVQMQHREIETLKASMLA